MEATKNTNIEKKKKLLVGIKDLVIECVAIAVWLLVIVRFISPDLISRLVVVHLPVEWHHSYSKWFLFLVLASIITVCSRYRSILTGIVYVIFYPAILVLWKVPLVAVKHWALTLAFAPAMLSFYRTFRQNVLAALLAAISALGVFGLSERSSIICSMTFLGFYLLIHFYFYFTRVLSPASLFTDMARFVNNSRERLGGDWIKKQIKEAAALPPESKDYETKYQGNIILVCMLNSFFYFVADRVVIAVSNRIVVCLIVRIVWTIIVTVLVFCLQYYGLEKLYPGSFHLDGAVSIWRFLGFSFGNVVGSGVSKVIPISDSAQLLAQAQHLLRWVLLACIGSMIFSAIKNRSEQELLKLKDELHAAADYFALLLEEECRLTIAQAEQILGQKDVTLVNWLRRMRGLAEISVASVGVVAPPTTTPLVERGPNIPNES